MSIIKMDEGHPVNMKRRGGISALVSAAPRGTYICDRCHQPFEAGTYGPHVRTSAHPDHQPIDHHTGRM